MNTDDLAFPFARELHEQHDALRATAHWIEAEAARLQDCDHREGFLLVPLRAFSHELGEHFRFEERHAFGLADPHGPHPHRQTDARLPEAVLAFVDEHRSIERRLAALLARIAAHQRPDCVIPPDVLADLRCIFEDLRRHDASESAFARQADIGGALPGTDPAALRGTRGARG